MRDDRRSERREGNGVEKGVLIQFISLWWATNKCNWRLKSIQERRVGEALQRGNQSRAGGDTGTLGGQHTSCLQIRDACKQEEISSQGVSNRSV